MTSQNDKIGNTSPICPYCGELFDKMPSRKSKCPKCNNYYYVRTRPADKQKVLVTEIQANQIEEQWAKLNGTYDQLITERQAFADEKSRLIEKFKRESSDNDVRWSLLNKQLIINAQNSDWGLYRNTKLEMAEILKREERFEAALSTYLEICYIDLNGPRNLGGLRDLNYSPFTPNEAFIAPGIVSRALSIIKKLGFDELKTYNVFNRIASANHVSIKLPVTPDDAWRKLKTELFKI